MAFDANPCVLIKDLEAGIGSRSPAEVSLSSFIPRMRELVELTYVRTCMFCEIGREARGPRFTFRDSKRRPN